MDPITTAIVAALSAGAISGLTETSKAAITDAYSRLKALLTEKFGGDSDVLQAVEQVENKPDSAGRKATLQEEITAVKADQDPDLMQAAQALHQLLETLPGREQHLQTATGNYIAQADRESSAQVNINQSQGKI